MVFVWGPLFIEVRSNFVTHVSYIVYKHIYYFQVHLRIRYIWGSRESSAPARDFFKPARKRKKHCSCILEGRLTTNPILSALHLQGLKSNIYVHFHLVNKSLNGIWFRKWNHQPRTQLTWKSKHYKILINIEVIIFVTYHLKLSLSF